MFHLGHPLRRRSFTKFIAILCSEHPYTPTPDLYRSQCHQAGSRSMSQTRTSVRLGLLDPCEGANVIRIGRRPHSFHLHEGKSLWNQELFRRVGVQTPDRPREGWRLTLSGNSVRGPTLRMCLSSPDNAASEPLGLAVQGRGHSAPIFQQVASLGCRWETWKSARNALKTCCQVESRPVKG